jgi:hypothetical protein
MGGHARLASRQIEARHFALQYPIKETVRIAMVE